MINRNWAESGAVTEPISRTDAKAHLKVETSADDSLIDSLITAARQWTEIYLGRFLASRTVTEKWDCFPTASNPIELRFSPVSAFTSIAYLSAGVSTAWNSTNYTTDLASVPARVAPKNEGSYPQADTELNAVTITYTAGYSTVPKPIIQAMLLMIGEMYEQRENTVKQLPTAAEYLLQPYRVWQF